MPTRFICLAAALTLAVLVTGCARSVSAVDDEPTIASQTVISLDEYLSLGADAPDPVRVEAYVAKYADNASGAATVSLVYASTEVTATIPTSAPIEPGSLIEVTPTGIDGALLIVEDVEILQPPPYVDTVAAVSDQGIDLEIDASLLGVGALLGDGSAGYRVNGAESARLFINDTGGRDDAIALISDLAGQDPDGTIATVYAYRTESVVVAYITSDASTDVLNSLTAAFGPPTEAPWVLSR